MMLNRIEHVRIEGIAACVPSNERDNAVSSYFSKEELHKVIENTGVKKRRVTDKICSSDLCYRAATRLLSELACDLNSIDVVIFVSQTPDYVLPATACVLQNKLSLSSQTMAFDINLGCSGYVYALIVAAQLLCTNVFKRVLLLTGDTVSKLVSDEDKTVALLFGDAGAATVLSYDETAPPLFFDYGTDGSGADALCVEAGAFRQRPTVDALRRVDVEHGNRRAQSELWMNGPEVFAFTINQVPKTVRNTLMRANWSKEDVDVYFFHQANAFMLNFLIKKMGLEPSKVPIQLGEIGNTSVASIPLTICLSREQLHADASLKIMLVGFGVGFSWASIAYQWANTKIIPVEYYGDECGI